jgi:hypothetical protein
MHLTPICIWNTCPVAILRLVDIVLERTTYVVWKRINRSNRSHSVSLVKLRVKSIRSPELKISYTAVS